MKILAGDTRISIKFDKTKKKANSIPVFFLHGFTGRGNDWDFIIDKLPERFLPIAIDIIGHGESDCPGDRKLYSEKSILEQLHTIVGHFGCEKNILFGYSMGGRIALSYASMYENNVLGLILESTSPGISDCSERDIRLANDNKLAENIARYGVSKFITYWLKQPFFSSLENIGEAKFHKLFQERSLNSKVGLTNILTQFGQGKMVHKWDMLNKLKFPVLLISGEKDKKYCEINRQVNDQLQKSEFVTVQNCGHNVHLEKEEEFINLAIGFLDKYF